LERRSFTRLGLTAAHRLWVMMRNQRFTALAA